MREDNFFAVYKTLNDRLVFRAIDGGTLSYVNQLYNMGLSALKLSVMHKMEKDAVINSVVDELKTITDYDDKEITASNYIQGIRKLKDKINDLELELDLAEQFEENAVNLLIDGLE